jgi:protein-L-isoaspartate(D-aspartate) O-methyltransferase
MLVAMDRVPPQRPRLLASLLGRKIPASLVWLFLIGVALGAALGLVLPRILPGAAPSGAIPAFLWRRDGSLTVHSGREAATLPASMLSTLPSAAVPAEVAAASNGIRAELATPEWDVTKELGTLPQDSKERFIAYMVKNYGEDRSYLEERWDLAQTLQETGELQGNAIEAFLRTPREHFVREANLARAYADTWMPIGYGATITDPDVVSMMTTTLEVRPEHRVLEIGTGSGYQSAILSHLSNHVYTIEIIEPLYQETDALYRQLETRYPGYRNITRKLGDGFYGWEKYAPFDRIIVTCAIDHLPPPLINQLTPDGIMVVPLGPPARQYIMKLERTTDAEGRVTFKRTDVYNGVGVQFIPFHDESGQSYSGQGG